ncbi:glucokinase [Telluria mixta]|uniref:Glucokinase n=1 Tax=Telluria mixta TaxID=34071 RepID=A0ABT2C4V0_9BURK|nr:glucokinase [Telluria mixta]MCS0632420.1 glucokinase [Telluria mixta]WEM94827.1 glucokinase [Telluria mixta]
MSALRLLADIGGTNARFALQAPGGGFADIEVLACRDYDRIDDAIAAYLARAAARGLPTDGIRHAAIAIANPVEGDVVSMTNHHWRFSIAGLRDACAFTTLLVVNDFAALAQALPHLGTGGRQRIGGTDSAAVEGRPIGLIGPGTGLGVSGVVPAGGGRWIALAGEGGHASFAPVDRDEMRLLDALWEEHGHVSAERLLSGPGLEAIHRVLAGERLAAADITARALDGSCAACRATVDAFCAILGSVAGNVALTLGATGGMYVGGGIVPRLGPLFHASAFRARFEGKGRLQAYLARIPTWLVTEPYPALRGVAALLDAATP